MSLTSYPSGLIEVRATGVFERVGALFNRFFSAITFEIGDFEFGAIRGGKEVVFGDAQNGVISVEIKKTGS